MRSASMPLLGLDETRMSLSARTAGGGGELRRLVRLVREGTQRPAETQFEASWSSHSRQSLLEEEPDAPVNGCPGFAVGTEVKVLVEVLRLFRAEGSVEKKVSDAFYIVTNHPNPS
jgi:hypothetical protein